MLKRIGYRKIGVTTCSLIIICLLYFFPNNDNLKVKQKISYPKENNLSVFLVDKNNYVSLVNVKSEKKNNIDYLFSNEKLPRGFKNIIPKGTKVLKSSVNGDTCVINFSKEFLNVKSKDKEKLYELVVYSLTIDSIKKVKILVEGKEIGTFTREMGINKEYDITSLRDINKTTVYYSNNLYNSNYYIPVTKVNNEVNEKIEIIINELKSSLTYQNNLSSYLKTDAELEKYSKEKNVMKLSFNDKIFDNFDNKDILEEVKYSIYLSVKDNYDIDEVVFYVNDKEITKSSNKTLEN